MIEEPPHEGGHVAFDLLFDATCGTGDAAICAKC